MRAPRTLTPFPFTTRRQSKLSDAQRLAWLRLIRSENVGPVTFRELINHFGGADQALARLPELSRRGGRARAIRICPADDAERELASADRIGARLVAAGESGYPPLLSTVDAPPPLLYVQGRDEVLQLTPIAIVGARNASAAGRQLTRNLAEELGRAGCLIVSGLARGIDGAAHLAALDSGTAAVVAGGIDVIYPPEHDTIHRQISERGLLISEQPPGFQPRGQDFPRRNRIISGMSYGVLVVEAARRSGSRITARFAAEQGREVFAVPGHPLDPRAEGTNLLIRSGATLVTQASDIIEVIEPMLRPGPGDLFSAAADRNVALEENDQPVAATVDIAMGDRERVVEALGPAPVEMNELARAAGVEMRHLRAILLELELAGRLDRPGPQLVALIVAQH